MPHSQGASRDTVLLFPPSLDEYITDDNPVRWIDAFIDQRDLQALGFTRAIASPRGRPAYHPADLLKLYVSGYLNRVRSSRLLQREAQRNVELMWLLKKLTPDFKTIADFRKDNVQPLRNVCRAFTRLCKDRDLFGGELVAIAGSKFAAVNHRSRHCTSKKRERTLLEIDAKSAAYLSELDTQDAERHARGEQKSNLQEKIAALQARRESGEAPALVANTLDVGPLPPEQWMEKLVNSYHIMLAAETGGGKSITAKAILAARVDAGDEVFINDPHSQPGNWFDLPAVGGGRNYTEVARALRAILAEIDSRYDAYNDGQGEFRRLTVLIDEVPAIYLHLDKAWKEFIKQLGSEARKVNISCVMLTQSPLVQDIGLNTSMQRNFRSVALDHACIRTLLDRAELNKARREVVAEKMSGQDFPAAVEFSGEVFLLDRSSLEHQRDHDLSQASWQGYELSVRPSASEEVAEIGVFRGCTDGRTRTDGEIVVSDDDKLDLLRAMRADGKTRDQARDTLAMLGVRFENADWTKAGD